MSEFFTDQNFKEEVLNFKGVALVDFGAEYCPSCRAIAPIIDELAKEYKDKAKIGKMDTIENPKTPEEYGIMAIPTLIFFKEGKAIDQIIGVQPKIKIKEKIDALLKE